MKALTIEALFDIKQKFLKEIPHPKLIQKQLFVLSPFVREEVSRCDLIIDTAKPLRPFLENYIQFLMALKLRVSNARDAKELYHSLHELLHLQFALISKLAKYLPEQVDVNDTDVKLSDPFDVHGYMRELVDVSLKENEIKMYLCHQYEVGQEMNISSLGFGVLRAHKIETNG